MARTVKTIPNNVNPQMLLDNIGAYLISEGCEYIEYHGERVFKKGKGFLVAPTYIKVTAYNNYIQIEGWMKYALLPGVYVGEINFEGFTGSAVRGPALKRMSTIENMIISANMQAQQNSAQYNNQ